MSQDTKDVIWRVARAIVASAVAQTLIIQVDWSKPDIALKTLLVSFSTGILMGLSKYLRTSDLGDEKTTTGQVIQKLPV